MVCRLAVNIYPREKHAGRGANFGKLSSDEAGSILHSVAVVRGGLFTRRGNKGGRTKSHSCCPGGPNSRLEPREHRRLHGRLRAFAENNFRLRRRSDAGLADGARSLREEIRSSRKNGDTHVFRGRNHPVRRECGTGARQLEPAPQRRSAAWKIHPPFPKAAGRLADCARSYVVNKGSAARAVPDPRRPARRAASHGCHRNRRC